MYRIVLCCASGMSTSLLVQKMQKAAQQRGIETEIFAINASKVKECAQNADVILLGPQVKYAQKMIAEDVPSVPIDLIGIKDYGMIDGEAVLAQAMRLMGL